MKFINIYNEDGTVNSMLNTNFLAKIDTGVQPNEVKGEKLYQIEYFLGFRYEEAYIKEKDYLELTTNQAQVVKETKPKVEQTKKEVK